MDASARPQWHNDSGVAALDALESQAEGLTSEQVAARRGRFGENRLLEQKPRSVWRRLASQFHNVLLYILLAAALLALLLGYYSDATVILLVVVINALVGFVQEGKAEAALRSIQCMLVSHCQVLRDGRPHTLEASELVPGDVVILAAGDRVPADLRLLQVRELYCDEAMLTGESVPVAKQQDSLPGDVPLAERRNMAWMGSLVTTGSAQGVVVATGMATQLGHIGNLVATVSAPVTPLTRALTRFGHQLALLIIVVSGIGLAWGGRHHGAGARRIVTGCRGGGGGGDSGRVAGGCHHYPGHRRATDGQEPCGDSQVARSGSARFGDCDLLRQDRHPDPQ